MSNLKEYNKKRNFAKTSEPKGIKSISKKRLKYVIQHHESRKDHFDLRLEYKGVYVSFAVPKGPSLNTRDKRLAIRVEDHPISYGNFEGIIPEGQYGAGTVMLFDKGYWQPNKKTNVDFVNGPIKFKINGKKLKGAWTLIKLKTDDKSWLLIKEQDEFVSTTWNIYDYDYSIKTNRTMDEIRDKFIKITHPKKEVLPGITKEKIANYYKTVAPRMQKFLDNRLISTIRKPNNELFYMKHLNTKSKNLGKKIINNSPYYYIKNELGLIEEVNQNSYEFHIWGCLKNSIKKPDILVFDFDPDEKISIKHLRDGVKDLKKILDELNLKSYLKTSGKKGYHVFVPLKTTSWKKTEEIASSIAKILVSKYPEKYTTNMRKNKRENKIFIDYFRNKEGATTVCPYSVRLSNNAPVSFPISWNSLDKIKPNDITINNLAKYLKRKDPWYDFFD